MYMATDVHINLVTSSHLFSPFCIISSADTRPGLVSAAVARAHNIEKKNKVSNSKNVFKPKAVVEHEKREEGLQSAISSDNKGFALLAKMGYKPGTICLPSFEGET
jgi:hypothetical protein